MGLFTKKEPCAICGGKVKGLFPWKVEGQLVCNDCYGRVDLPDDYVNNMTMEEFRAYRQYREENAKLKEKFQIKRKVSLGAFTDKIVIDTVNGLFCMDEQLERTIFTGKQIKSFTIKEDGVPLYEGSAAGLVCHTSDVPERLLAMAPLVQRVARMKQREREEERRARRNEEEFYIPHYHESLPEPFKKFKIRIYCKHPYWKVLKAERDAPTFNDSYPSVQDYLRDYQEGTQNMEKLAHALMKIAFPDAQEQRAHTEAAEAVAPAADAAPAVSAAVVADLQQLKALVEQGILTEEEFAAKKRQLLGI